MTADGFGIFLNGSYGVGKSAVLEHLADRFAERRFAFSLFDVDWFHRSWPVGAEDPANVLVEAENIRAVWRNYRSAGPRTPIVAGVIRRQTDLDRYEACFDLPLRPVLLTASDRVTGERLRIRYTPAREEVLRWHLQRHRELAGELLRFPGHELVVDTDGRTPAEIAGQVFDEFAPGFDGASP